ncbi:uncharacterized protein LOC132718913 [Ruditapes philippinarum]|uniref:uncharacterized protein LOC132718913 n=1 Tax=Ruditapes philippinarum TaxID=129788 RepID=UPI00295B2E3C|nr:uncharacterized protein LOC132718913 [Ruditapes philippinarum]
MATRGQPQTLDNREFLFRLQILIIDGGLLVLRNLLDRSLTSQRITLSACLNQEKPTITHLKRRGVITQVQYDVLFPAGGNVPTSSDLDITLIICLLRNLKCFGLNKKFDWSATPAPTDVSKEADICRLKVFRNKISHISTTTAIQQNEFTAWWNDIELILVRRSTSALNIQQTIAEFKTCPLDLEEERRIQKEIKKWKDYEDDVDRLKQEMTVMKENVTDAKEDLEDVKVNVTDVKKDLEDIKENNTAVNKDLQDIKQKVTEVKKDFKDVKANVTDVKKNLEDVKENDTAVKRDLEDIKANVTNVTKGLEDIKENDTAVKRNLESIKENVIEVKKDFEDAKENDTAMKRDIEDIKENVTDLKRNFDETKRRQRTDETRPDRQKNGNIFQRFLEWTRYKPMKRKLQGDLIKFYRQRCSSIPLSPLLEEVETPLAGFYVMPDIVIVKQKSLNSIEEERIPVKSLRKLFLFESRYQQEMYLSADAGFGKTAFSKYLAVTWCQAHCHDENYASFKKSELKTLLDFEFLFLIFLRDSPSVCKIYDMIEQQITGKLPTSVTLYEVLRREKCLIILDGLDEWTHPDNSCSEVTEKIPHLYEGNNCVILTTTRPWKLGVSNLKTSQINKKVELVQLSADSTRKLEENAIRKMTGVRDDRVLKSKRQDFDNVIRDCRLEHMQGIPLLLMYIVALWCNNIPLGNSKHEIYTKIIEFLLSRTSKKHPEVQPSRESSASEIPEYFKSHKFCKHFYSLITSLAELAYQTLSHETREYSLVFDRMVAEQFLKADDMKLSLLSGILSESRSKNLVEEIIKVSFSHKTMQEFFAAIFISSHGILEKCRNVQDILDMSKICEFISKIDVDHMCTISKDVMSLINEDEITRDYRTRTGDEIVYNTPLYNLQKMFMLCLQEMPESENIQLCLQDFFIDDDTVHSEQLQRLLKQNKTNIKSLYINTGRTSSSSLREIIDLFSLADLSHIQKLHYAGGWKETKIESLQNVALLHCTLRNNEKNLSENMARCQNLQYLYIEYFTLSHKILETFLDFISGQKSMKELTLLWLHCKEHGRHDCNRLNLDLSQHSTLSKLVLREFTGRLQLNISTPSLVYVTLFYISLTKGSLLLSRDMLNIERVKLTCIEMSEGSLQNFITVLENLPQSVIVEMRDIKPCTEYGLFTTNIRRSPTFHVINDDWRRFVFKNIVSLQDSSD